MINQFILLPVQINYRFFSVQRAILFNNEQIAVLRILIPGNLQYTPSGQLIQAGIHHMEFQRVVGHGPGDASGIRIIRQNLTHEAILEHLGVGNGNCAEQYAAFPHFPLTHDDVAGLINKHRYRAVCQLAERLFLYGVLTLIAGLGAFRHRFQPFRRVLGNLHFTAGKVRYLSASGKPHHPLFYGISTLQPAGGGVKAVIKAVFSKSRESSAFLYPLLDLCFRLIGGERHIHIGLDQHFFARKGAVLYREIIQDHRRVQIVGPVGKCRPVPLDPMLGIKHIVVIVLVVSLPEQIRIPGVEHDHVRLGPFRIDSQYFFRIVFWLVVDIGTAVLAVLIPRAVAVL